MLAHVPSFGRNPRGSPDFLAYPVPKACMHVLGTWVPRRLGVARSASSPKAALALACSLTPGLRISFGRVTCMARAAPVPGLWALGFLLKRYPEPMAHGPKACEPSHPLWPMAQRPASRHTRAEAVDTGYPCSLTREIWNPISNQ